MSVKRTGGDGKGDGSTAGVEPDFTEIQEDDASSILAAGKEGAKQKVVKITAAIDVQRERLLELRENIPDIAKRAEVIKREHLIHLRDNKSVGGGVNPMSIPLMSDLNLLIAFSTLFGESGEVYFDTFRARTIAWNGDPIDDNLDLEALLDALTTFSLPQPTWDRVETLLKRFARKFKVNTLQRHVESKMPDAWDGVKRLDESLIRLFDCQDTPLTRDFSRYFWLSLYARCMTPGWNAPMVLTLVGPQGAGKSYFGKLICEELMGDPDADVVPFDLSMDFNDFLRTITGRSLVANIAEMSGYNRGDLNKIKGFVTKTSDQFHHKYENVQQQLRQWVMIMDGNSYLGLQRDDTGNRRFYPICVAFRGFREDGDFAYQQDFEVDFSSFRSDVWLYMAECRAWFASFGSERAAANAYQGFVSGLIKRVNAFSLEEMRMDRGTVRDDHLADALIPALRMVNPEIRVMKEKSDGAGRPITNVGAFVPSHELLKAFGEIAGRGNFKLIPAHLKTKLEAMGARQEKVNQVRGYIFGSIESIEDWEELLGLRGSDDSGVEIIRPLGKRNGDNGGF